MVDLILEDLFKGAACSNQDGKIIKSPSFTLGISVFTSQLVIPLDASIVSNGW